MKIKDSLIIYLPQRIILFPLHLYINNLITRVLNRLYDWEFDICKKITGKEKYFKFFLEKEILDILLEIKTIFKNLNVKVFTFFKETNNLNLEYFESNSLIYKIIIKIFKKVCGKYFIYKIPRNLNFNPGNKIYKNLKCGEPTGEELEFLAKLTSD
jgi:hypothetical protein